MEINKHGPYSMTIISENSLLVECSLKPDGTVKLIIEDFWHVRKGESCTFEITLNRNDKILRSLVEALSLPTVAAVEGWPEPRLRQPGQEMEL